MAVNLAEIVWISYFATFHGGISQRLFGSPMVFSYWIAQCKVLLSRQVGVLDLEYWIAYFAQFHLVVRAEPVALSFSAALFLLCGFVQSLAD